jgi:methionyl-tRNA formyltransferase
MYKRDQETGFTFHHMTERIDDGGILLQSSIPITPDSSYRALEIKKALLARSFLNQVLDKLISREEGIRPEGKDKYFSRKAWQELITIDNSRDLTAQELRHRLRCFEILRIRIEDQYYPTTDVVELSQRKRLGFHTREGILMAPRRFLYLPYPLFRLYDWVRPGQW